MIGEDEQQSILQILIELREDAPEFRQTMASRGYRAGQTVAEGEDLDQGLFLLMNGQVLLGCERPSGQCLAVAVLHPGAVFGDGAVSGREVAARCEVKAVALTDCVVWTVPAVQAQQLVSRYPLVADSLSQRTSARLLELDGRLEHVARVRLPRQEEGQ